MNEIEKITNKLFSINYEIDFENENVFYENTKIAEELIRNNNWVNVYNVWYNYLITKCITEDSIINYLNLFWCYEGYKHSIYNAFEFCSYFYAKINLIKNPEVEYLLEGMVKEVFYYSGIYSQEELYEYIPTNDVIFIDYINNWKK